MPAVRYQFVATGSQDVVAAFRSVAKESQRTAAQVEKAATKQTRASTKAASASAKSEERRWKEAEAAGKKIEREFAREERQRARHEERRVKASEKAATTAAKVEERRVKTADKVANAMAKAEERRVARTGRTMQKYWADVAKDNAKRKAAADKAVAIEKKAAAELRADRNQQIGSVAATVGRFALGAGIAAGAAALGLAGSAGRQSVALGELANRGAINAGLAGEKVSASDLKSRFEATALAAPGTKSEDVANAFLAFQAKTGKSASGGMLDVFATTAQAGGGSIEDIAAAAASLSQKFDITGIEEMREALAALTVQGAKGSFEMKDAAGQFEKLSSAASRFGLDKGVKGAATLGGLTQIARSATGSSEQAATAVEATLRQIVSQSKTLEGKGVQVFTDKGKTRTRDVQDILVDTISKTGGNLPTLQKVFGEEGIRAISPLISTFNETKAATKGTDAEKTAAGVVALRKALDAAISTTGAVASVNAAAAQAQQNSSAQITAAWEKVVASASDTLAPALISLAAQMPTLVEAIVPVIGVFGELAKGLGGTIEMLKDAGILAGTEATKSVRSKGERDKLQADIDKLEAKGENRTDAETARLERMKDTLRVSEVAAPGRAAPGPRGRGFKGIGDGPAVPLEGSDALDAILGTPSPGNTNTGPVVAAGGDMGKNNERPEIDTSKAQTSVDQFASTLLAAMGAIKASGQGSILGPT